MNIGRACGIFMNIDSDNFTEDEKLIAIRDVLKEMVTYNGITKDNILKAFRWFFDWAVEETTDGVEDLIRLIEEQPRGGEWIPCSERLPEEYGLYLTSTGAYYNKDTVEMLYFDPKEEFDVEFWVEKVDAWMPLPEPYKEEA